MKKLGLTGGIGVGKTYVSKVFQQMGIPVFNADVEAKNCMAEDKGLMQNVKNSFGENIYTREVPHECNVEQNFTLLNFMKFHSKSG